MSRGCYLHHSAYRTSSMCTIACGNTARSIGDGRARLCRGTAHRPLKQYYVKPTHILLLPGRCSWMPSQHHRVCSGHRATSRGECVTDSRHTPKSETRCKMHVLPNLQQTFKRIPLRLEECGAGLCRHKGELTLIIAAVRSSPLARRSVFQ